jgi:DNA gyrase subunit B
MSSQDNEKDLRPEEQAANDAAMLEPEKLTGVSSDEGDSIASKVTNEYTSDSIQVLKGLEAVRHRPGMYVGDNGKRGLHQLYREVIDNSVDEALAGYCDRINVVMYADNSISVEDNGRGIPVSIHKEEGISTLQVVLTMLHAGGKFGGEDGGYKVSGGLHGVGVSCTNALSAWLVATVKREGKLWQQRYEQGVPTTDIQVIGEAEGTGTMIRWHGDPEVLSEIVYDSHIVKNRLKELAYLNPKVVFDFKNEMHPEEDETFHYERGIIQLVEHLNSTKDEITKKVVYFKRLKEGYELEVALQYHSGYNQTILAFSNNIHQPDGGTHVSGFSMAVTRVLNQYARKMNFLKEKDKNFTSDDVGDGLTAVIALKLQNPSYNSQDKVKLVNPEVQGLANSLVGDGLNTFLEENPQEAKRLIDKALIAQRAREAARKAAETVKRQSTMDSFGLPGKLSDCMSKEVDKCEIFIVEGDSAGGSAKGGRDRMTQAILPLRGKILNVERARIDKALDNEEIKSLIAALGIGIDISTGRMKDEDGEVVKDTSFDLGKLRYGKIIIMTDADVDGEHIRTLLLTFFYRYMRPLIEEGHIYLAQPPLFVVKVGTDERHYCQDQADLDRVIKTLGKKKNWTVGRFKGLGEMNAEELEETTMNPANRRIVQVKLDPEFAMEVETMFSTLMGDKVEPRREFIQAHARDALNLDWHY